MSNKSKAPKAGTGKGGRPRTGTVVTLKDGRRQAIITLPDGSRKRFKPFAKGTSEAYARERAAFYAEQAERLDLHRPPKLRQPGPVPRGELVSAYLDRVFKHRGERGLKRQEVERSRLRNHVEPVLESRGVRTMAEVTKTDCEAIVENLDRTADSGQIGGKTAVNTWSLWKTICKGACASKVAALRVRTDNPCDSVLGPEKGTKKAKQWLYPEEFDQLVRCENVPLRWRRLYVVASYLCLRAGELGALEAEDIDLVRGRVRVHRAIDRETLEVGPTKTEDVRVLDVPKTVLPLLKVLMEERGGAGRLVELPPFEDLAETLRRHVQRAGITRRELFDPTESSIRLRFHDLRASGISWLAMLPDWTQFDVRDYAGHSEVSTTDLYVRRGRKARDNCAQPFPALPDSLLGVSIKVSINAPPLSDEPAKKGCSPASPTGFEPVLQP